MLKDYEALEVGNNVIYVDKNHPPNALKSVVQMIKGIYKGQKNI